MFEDFKTISIQGGYFDTKADLNLFDKDAMSVVYGRNGSGKSTIARCVRQLVENEEQKNERLANIASGDEVEYTVSSVKEIPEEDKKSVFVFDEDFVRVQVRIKGKNGLPAIVMFGPQGDLDTQIDKKEEELKNVKAQLKALSDLKGEYEDANNSKSPDYYFAQIRQNMLAEGGWSSNDRDIRGNVKRTSVYKETLDEILKIAEPAESVGQLRSRFEKDLNVYRKSDKATAIVWKAPVLSCPRDLVNAEDLLRAFIEKPNLSDREQRLFKFLETHRRGETEQLLEEGWEFCPLCLREIDYNHRHSIADMLTKLLNKQASEYKMALSVAVSEFQEVVMGLLVFPQNLHQNECNAAQVALDNLNMVLERIRSVFVYRSDHLYDKMDEPFTEDVRNLYHDALDRFDKAMSVLTKLVKDFNDAVAGREAQLAKLNLENQQLARKELAPMLVLYQQANADTVKVQSDWKAKDDERARLVKEIDELKAKKDNTKIALDYINTELQYVYYSERKVKLVEGKGCYKLTVNGRSVSPDKISVGERNVLGLCYFFANLFTDKEDKDKYKQEYLLVVDDPVSSFDYGNRLGVMSLLRYQFNAIKKGNANSRILVMSHDLRSVFDLVKIRNEVCKEPKNAGKKKGYFELVNKNLKPRETQNEYMKLLQYVYEYATKTIVSDKEEENVDLDDSREFGVGNTMRKMMEAFASFCYNTSFEEMLRMENLLDCIEPGKKRDYYENFMCRLALNTESHTEEKTYSLDNMTPFYTTKEKLQTAKSVLLFLSYINKPHLTAYLSEDEYKTVESWQNDETEWLKDEENES